MKTSKGDLARFTTAMDHRVIVALEEIAITLRQQGYTRMSRSYLISAVSGRLVDIYKTSGVDGVFDIIGPQLESYADEKKLNR